MRILDAIYESARTGHEIILKEENFKMKLVKKLGLLAAGLALTTALVYIGNNDKKEESAKSKDNYFNSLDTSFVGTELKAEQTEVLIRWQKNLRKTIEC